MTGRRASVECRVCVRGPVWRRTRMKVTKCDYCGVEMGGAPVMIPLPQSLIGTAFVGGSGRVITEKSRGGLEVCVKHDPELPGLDICYKCAAGKIAESLGMTLVPPTLADNVPPS